MPPIKEKQSQGGMTGFKPSPEQEKVIAHRGGHLQVIACAGAGKTEAISRRVAALITEGVEPTQIVAFTFTERAAASLKNRITKRIAEAKGPEFLDRLGPMYIGTIHAYCLRLLHDHVPEFGDFDIVPSRSSPSLPRTGRRPIRVCSPIGLHTARQRQRRFGFGRPSRRAKSFGSTPRQTAATSCR